jgi:electron-transferring-flavoprotein dehydrogenase
MSDKIEYDVLLIGGSPSNFALAHHLLDLAKTSNISFSMAILEKGKEFGSHNISGAVVQTKVLKRLFPDFETSDFPKEGFCSESNFSVLGTKGKWDVPNGILPPGLRKHGYAILTLSHVVYWMYNKLMEKAAECPNVTLDMFPGFSAHQVVFDGEKVVGVQVVEESTGSPEEDNIYGKVTCFGDKGFISRDVIDHFKLRDNPQLWSVGVKEVWQLADDKDYSGKVWHTMGYPLTDGSFGGGFVYGMKDKKLTIGLIVSLDSQNPNINPQQKLQDLKKHPWIQDMIKDGKLLKYGAAVLPEGGYYSLPKEFAVDGAMLVGDALGVLDQSTLNGISNGLESGWQAAEVIHEALKAQDFSQAKLRGFKEKFMASEGGQALKTNRYFHHAWKENDRLLNNYLPKVMNGIDGGSPFSGLISIGLANPFQSIGDALRLKSLMEGTQDIGMVKYKPDYTHIVPDFKNPRPTEIKQFSKETIYSRVDAVFYANTKYHEHNQHIDEFNADTCVTCIATYDKLGKDTPCVSDCTAEVHRIDEIAGGRKHGMSLENCVQCRTCEIVCPEVNLRVKPTSEGSGPDYMGL